MKKHMALITIILLFVTSAVIYFIQFEVFHDPDTSAFYMLQDWAFLPVQIAIVTIAVGMIVNEREKRQRLSRTRTLASSFFRDFGTDLISAMIKYADPSPSLSCLAFIDHSWTSRDYIQASAGLKATELTTHCTADDLLALKPLLLSKKADLQAIASNSALLEHEDFTDMLWAIFHLTDELIMRGSLENQSAADMAHLNVDAERALRGLLSNWLCHIEHISTAYPYLYLLELEKNPVRAALR